MALKPCQGCHREVDTTAVTCPNCGRPRPTATKPKSSIVRLLLMVFVGFPVAIIGLFILVGLAKSCEGDRPSPAARAALPPEPLIQVDATKLWDDYHANEVAADEIYKGKRLAVVGVLASIDKDAFDNIVLHLQASNPFMNTMARLEDSQKTVAMKLRKGERVRLACRGDGMIIGTPALSHCTVTN